jgi:hypothetical protein
VTAGRFLAALVAVAGGIVGVFYPFGGAPSGNEDTLRALGFGVCFVGVMIFFVSLFGKDGK